MFGFSEPIRGVNGCKSTILDVISGVPQGSVLGRLLFIIYTNSMVEKAGSRELFLYADDLKVYSEIESVEDVQLLQQDLDRLYDWTTFSSDFIQTSAWQ